MRRVWNFAVVDFLKVRRFAFVILFPALGAVLMIMDPSASGLFAVMYSLFGGIILSSFPYNMESEDEKGFLQMLPSRPGELVLGHFLFAALTVTVFFVLGLAAILVAHWFVPALDIRTLDGMDISGVYLMLLGVGLVVAGIQNLLMTVFRFENVHLMQLMRIVPAFVFFFALNSAGDALAEQEGGLQRMALAGGAGWIVLLLCLVVFVLLALAAAAISRRTNGN